MFRLPDDTAPFRVVGIDPGTTNVGLSVIDVDLSNGGLTVADTRTIDASKMIRGHGRMIDVYGNRFARLNALEDAMVEHFQEWQPHTVISESPFFNPRRPNAYAALVEAVSYVQRAVHRYNDAIPLCTIDPSSAKKNAGVNGKSSDKTLVNKALPKLKLFNPYGFDYAALDEHSADSLIIAYYRAVEILKAHI